MKFEFLKDRYDFELARKEHLTGALTMPIGVVSGVGGLVVAMARSFTYHDPMTLWMFGPLIVADAVSFVVCLLNLARVYHMQTYIYLPLLDDLEKAQDEFRDFNSYVRSSGGDVEETFADDLRKRIIQAADQNTRTNERRSELLRIARLWLFAVLWITFFAAIPYIANQVRHVMPTEQAPKPAQTTPASAPQKPDFPQNRVVKEGGTGGNVKKVQ